MKHWSRLPLALLTIMYFFIHEYTGAAILFVAFVFLSSGAAVTYVAKDDSGDDD